MIKAAGSGSIHISIVHNVCYCSSSQLKPERATLCMVPMKKKHSMVKYGTSILLPKTLPTTQSHIVLVISPVNILVQHLHPCQHSTDDGNHSQLHYMPIYPNYLMVTGVHLLVGQALKILALNCLAMNYW